MCWRHCETISTLHIGDNFTNLTVHLQGKTNSFKSNYPCGVTEGAPCIVFAGKPSLSGPSFFWCLKGSGKGLTPGVLYVVAQM